MRYRMIVSFVVTFGFLSAVAASYLSSESITDADVTLASSAPQSDTIRTVSTESATTQTTVNETAFTDPETPLQKVYDILDVTADPQQVSDKLEIEQARAREQALQRELAIQKAKTRELQLKYMTPKEQPASRDRRLVQVFFATDRNRTDSDKLNNYFGAHASRELTFGTCDVLVPQDHRMGYLERPFTIAAIPLSRESDSKHVVLKKISTVQDVEFFRQLSARVQQSRRQEAFVFVHGFNVTFAEAARRTAQIAYDLAFEGAPILYSWPSHGTRHHYVADEDAVDGTVPRLEMFLSRLAVEGRVDTVYLIAHSMGNRALIRALERIYLRNNGAPPNFRYRQLMLTAPDVRTSVLQDLAKALKAMSWRVTLYSSDNDRALKFSRQIHNYTRAGQAGDHLLLLDGIDTIDVSAVDSDLVGHFYYAGNRSVLADIFQSIRCAEDPGERFSLERRERQGMPYWVFVP